MKSIQIQSCVRTSDLCSGRHRFGCSALLLIALTASLAAQQTTPKHVLLLNSFTERSAFDSVTSVESAVRSRAPWPVDFYVEFLEGFRLDDPAYENALVVSFRNAYSKNKLDLVIVAARPALNFALKHRDELFSGAPIVFMEMSAARVPAKMWPGVTGVTATVDVHATIDLALRLHPGTTTVAVITNDSAFEKYWLAMVHNDIAHRSHNLNEIDFIALPPEKLLQQVNALPPHSIALFQEAPQESNQPVIGPYEALASVAQRVPTYSIFPVICLGRGCVGGASWDNQEQTSVAAEMARRVLSGEKPENIPVVYGKTDQIRVDWRQLQRWHILQSALPPGSIILNREPTFWERDRNYVIAGIVMIIIQSFSILGLLMQRARKRKAEAVLRESEKRFRVMADNTPSIVWMSDTEGKLVYLNDRGRDFTGSDSKAGLGDTWKTYVHPDDFRKVFELDAQALLGRKMFSREFRLRRKDDVYRWMFDVASPRINGDESFAGFIGSAIDVTDQKLAQEALENVSGRLIEAQERERTRIARDLHDDICQRLAVLSMELEQANRNGSPPAARKRLEEIRQHCADIASDVQSLSHQLHSSKLDYLGIVAATRGFCREFSKQHDLVIDFRDKGVPTHVPQNISLCLFRVAQEALHNAVKYSGTRHFVVELQATGSEVRLTVSDAGVGFNVEQAKSERGLGLVSMQERVHLVHGRFHIESAPGAGTRITAIVPRPADAAASVDVEDADGAATGAA